MSQRGTILVVEDDKLIQLAIADLLESEGHAVETASSGEDGIGKIRRLADKLEALITDTQLGDGPSGWAVARLARTIRQDLPVIYMSGTCCEDWEKQWVFPSQFFSKPVIEKELLAALP